MLTRKKGKLNVIKQNDDKLIDSLAYIVSFLAMIITLYPILYIISASFSDPISVASGKVILFPQGFTLAGYERILAYKPIWTGYRNTIFYTAAGTLINLVVTLPAAYALSREDLDGRNIITMLFAFTMFFSGGIIPTYLVVRQLNIINTVWAMILPVAASMWNIIIARTFFQSSIPSALQDAAYIDGSSTIRLFLNIILPLSMPLVAVQALFYAVGHWNSYFGALIYLSDNNLFPLQLILRNILLVNNMAELTSGDYDTAMAMLERLNLRESMKFGIIVVSSVPLLVIYPFLQKFFVKGIMVGAIKG